MCTHFNAKGQTLNVSFICLVAVFFLRCLGFLFTLQKAGFFLIHSSNVKPTYVCDRLVHHCRLVSSSVMNQLWVVMSGHKVNAQYVSRIMLVDDLYGLKIFSNSQDI